MCSVVQLLPLIYLVFSSYLSGIETLIFLNSKKRDTNLALGLMDMAICLLEDKPNVNDDDVSSSTKGKVGKVEQVKF